jgi:hypothetical protein
MPNVIMLDSAQADTVRGPAVGAEFHAIVPVALSDGRFYVGTEVLDDPVHAEHHDLLASCPQEDYDAVKGLLPQEDHP